MFLSTRLHFPTIFITIYAEALLMKILYFELDGYKNIENAHIDLSDITTLMALNAKGKSNLLRGILFGLSLLSANNVDLRNVIYQSESALSKPLVHSSINKPFRFGIQAQTQFEGNDVKLTYSFCMKWGEKIATFLSEDFKIQEFSSQRPTTYYSREGIIAKYKGTKTRGVENETHLPNPTHMINNLLLGKNLYYEPLIQELSSIRYVIDRHFDNSRSYNAVSIFTDDDFSFGGNRPENTPQNMYLLKTGFPRHFRRIISAMQTLFPDVTEIDVKKINEGAEVVGVQNYYLLYAKQKNMDSYINCGEMSDGFKRILNSLIVLTISEIKGFHVVALEEPENSINPTVLGKYIQIIAEFTDAFNIILTSHSPFLLQYIPLRKIYIGIENQGGNISFKKIRSTYIKRVTEQSEKLDVTTGTYIFDTLSNEERFDRAVLKEALED